MIMRRFISYLSLSFTAFLLIGFNVLSVVGGLNANLEFTSGQEMVFRISDKNTEDAVFADNEAVTKVANTMISRLESALVTKYDVFTEGNNQVRVTVSESSEAKYKRLETYLGFDADFTLCTKTEICATNEQMFDGQTARVEYRGQNPFVVIPVKDSTYLKEVLVKEAEGSNPSEEGSGNGELLLWAGKVEEDNYDASLQNPEIQSKIVLRFTTGNLWWDNETTNELAAGISPSKYGTANANNIFEAAAVSQANEEAIYYRNLFNATALDVNVEFLYSTPVAPSVEPILNLGEVLTLSLGQTFFATIFAAVISIVVLFVLYRLAALSMVTTTAVSLFVATFAFIWLKLEFSSAALLALFTIAALGIFTGSLFMSTFRREVYAGRSIKKAHIEANGQIFPLVFDVTVVALIFGLFAYLFGGNLVRTFSVLLMMGSLTNLIFVYLGNRLLLGLLLNDFHIQQNLSLIQLDSKLIPNLVNDEKPVYFGRFAARDFTAKGTLISPIAFMGALVSLIALIGLTTLDIPVIQPVANQAESRLYVEVREFSQFDTTADVEEKILSMILVDGEPLAFEESTMSVFEFSRREDDLNIDYRLYVTTLNVRVNEETNFVFTGDDFETNNFDTLLEHIVYGFYEDEQVALVSFNQGEQLTNQPTVSEIAFGALIALLFVGVYLAFRTSLPTALATLLVAGSTALVTLGLFIATRIPSSSILALSLLLVSFIATILVLAIFARTKALVSTIKDRKLVIDDYTLAIKKATSQSASFIFVTLLTLLYPSLTFLGIGPSPLQGLFASVLVGVAFTALFVTGIVPISFKPFYQLFKGVNILFTFPVRKNSKRVSSGPTRSNEPQESTFIGIND
jgi:preprotein translocase subunit SecD